MIDRPKYDAGAGPDVHELQALARQAARARRRRRKSLSRAARLQLIDMLSRWAGSGLALIAGVAIFIAVSAGRAYPLRASVFAVTVLGALWLCRRLQKEFRSGEKIAARPFRWRANYTAALAVLSAAFGAGALIAVPATAPGELVFQTYALIIAAAYGAGVLHAAHGRAAAAACLPATAFVMAAALQPGGPALAALLVGAAAIAGAAALAFFHSFLRERTSRRFPRTGFVRREIDAIARGEAEEARGSTEIRTSIR